MLFTHILKAIEYFVVEGIDIPFNHMPEVIEGFAYNLIKLIVIYFSMLG